MAWDVKRDSDWFMLCKIAQGFVFITPSSYGRFQAVSVPRAGILWSLSRENFHWKRGHAWPKCFLFMQPTPLKGLPFSNLCNLTLLTSWFLVCFFMIVKYLLKWKFFGTPWLWRQIVRFSFSSAPLRSIDNKSSRNGEMVRVSPLAEEA